MLNSVVFGFFVLLVGSANCQSSNPDFLFENFEYASAISGYNNLAKQASLTEEENEKLAFCYYILGNHKNGLPFINSVISKNENKAHYWLWKGTLEKEAGQYDLAIKSLNSFRLKSNELKDEVDLMIKSCKELPKWSALVDHNVSNEESNDRLANSYGHFGETKIWYFEKGVDSLGNVKDKNKSVLEFSEAVLVKPFVLANGEMTEVKMFESFPHLSISTITYSAESKQMIYSAADPLNKRDNLKVQQLYVSSENSLDTPINSLILWEHSGVSDSSSCTHPTLSNSGKTMVFSKLSTTTRGSDLYVSNFEKGVWSIPAEVKGVNTFGNEMFPKFQGDSILFFSTDGRVGYGGLDIHSVPFNGNEIGKEVTHYKEPINSSLDDYNFSWVDTHNGSFVSNRNGGKGDDDNWKLNIKIHVPVVIVEEPVADGFEEWLEEWHLKPIYFDFDSFEGQANDDFIAGCIRYFEKYDVMVKLIGHTDTRGEKSYNKALGLNRSNWLRDQLMKAGVKNTIAIESIGEEGIINGCVDSKECSEEEHQLNRFVQIQIAHKSKISE